MKFLSSLALSSHLAHAIVFHNGPPYKDRPFESHSRIPQKSDVSDTDRLSRNMTKPVHIIPESKYSCYGFETRKQPRKYNQPILSSGLGWPSLTRGTRRIEGLVNPRAFVVSLAAAQHRREKFAERWTKLNLDLPATWVEAVDAVHKKAVTEFIKEFTAAQPEPDQTSPTQAACWESHAGIITAATDTGDLLIFEDDATFIDDFPSHLSTFIANVPEDWDLLHIGGDDFWEPPISELPGKWIRARSVSRTWGYIIRGPALRRLQTTLSLTMDLRAIDTILGGLSFACNSTWLLKTYVPEGPFVYQADGSQSMTGQPVMNFDYEAEVLDEPPRMAWEVMSCCLNENVSWMPWCCSRGQETWERPSSCRTSTPVRNMSLLRVSGADELPFSSVCRGISTCRPAPA